jgi:hypothetical protein
MGKRRKPGSICLHTLLVALAIQGVTPDAYDLASLKLPQVLEAVNGRTASWANGSSPVACIFLRPEAEPPSPTSEPWGGEDQESTPDELGVSAGLMRYGLSLHKPGKPLKLKSVKADRPGQTSRSGLHRFTRRRGSIGTGSGLIHSLCRLTC